MTHFLTVNLLSKCRSQRTQMYYHNYLTTLYQIIRGIAESVWGLATGWTVRGLNPVGGEKFRTCPDRPWGPPSNLHNGYRVFPGDKAAGVWR
jgi:hypothetical protein